MWGDSDIPCLQQMTDPERIKKIMSRGAYFTKIEAKVTETSQPLYLGPFFKILNQSGRNMTYVGIDSPLSTLVNIIFTSLRKKKLLLLSTLKENALKDCINTSPDIIVASFSKHTLTQSFVSAGIIYDKTKTCTDMYTIMESFKIYWNKVKGGKRWFIDIPPKYLSEMFIHGEVSKDFYKQYEFPLDRDYEGNFWYLSSAADQITRSKVSYPPKVIAKK